MLESRIMEYAVRIHVEALPEGLFLATSEDVAGLVAQGGSVGEVLEIARDVARQLVDARRERDQGVDLPAAVGSMDFTIVVAE